MDVTRSHGAGCAAHRQRRRVRGVWRKGVDTTNVKGMKLLWKVKLPSTPREMHNLFPPLIVEHVTTPQGSREMAIVTGVSDDLFGIDVVSGETMWRTHFDSTYAPQPGG